MKTIATFIVRRRFWLILLIGLFTAFFAAQIRHLKIVIDPSAMLPKAHLNVIGTTLAEKLFGSKYVVVIGVSAVDGGTALQPAVLQTVADLSRDLLLVPGVKAHTLLSATAERAKAISGAGHEMKVQALLPTPITADGIAALAGLLADNPVYQNTVMSKDQTLASISFSVDVGPKGFREVIDKVQVVMDRAQSPQIKVISSGTAVFFANVERFSARMAFLFPIALLLIGLIHLEAFRTKQGLFLPLVTAILAVIWSLGIMGAAGVSMDAFNATTPILILAVAAGHAVQILKRYYEEYERLCAAHPHDPLYSLNDRAIVDSLTKVAPVMLTAGFVAALGFLSLVTFEITNIRTFGIFTGLGILSALLIELTFIPALRSYLPAPKPTVPDAAGKPRFWDRVALALTQLVIQRHRSLIAGFALLAALAVVAMSNINRENSTKSYFGDGLQLRLEDRLLNNKLAGTNTLYVVFQGNRVDHMKDPAVLAAMASAQDFIATLPDVGKTISIVDLIKQMNRAMNSGDPGAYAIPATSDLVSQYLLLYSLSGQPTDFDSFLDYDYRNANLQVWMKNDSSKYAERVVDQIRKHIVPTLPAGVTIQIGGSVPQTSALSETLVDGKMRNIAQMMGFVFVAGVLVFRSLVAGLYLVLPLLFTVLVNFGVMGLTGIPLNTPNSVSSAMAIGIGADYAIYLLYRMREELRQNPDVDVALLNVMKTAGKAVVYVASAISCGYAVLMLSFNFYVHIWFGLLIVLSMIVSATSALVLIPSLIKLATPRFLRGDTANDTPNDNANDDPIPDPIRSQSLARSTPASTMVLALATALMAGMLTGVAPVVQAQDMSGDQLMEKNYHATRVNASVSEVTFRLVSASGQERTRKTFGATKLQPDGAANSRVIRFLAPSDLRNTTTLMLENTGKDDEIWVYLPALKKARRLASSNKRNSFVGTDLSFGDLVGHKATDWSHKILRQDNLAGLAATIVESTPKTPAIGSDAGYSKRVSWVAKDSFVSLKVDFYDLGGALLKTLENSQIKTVDAAAQKYQPMVILVKNHQTGHTTHLKMDRFDASVNVPESYFQVGYIEREE